MTNKEWLQSLTRNKLEHLARDLGIEQVRTTDGEQLIEILSEVPGVQNMPLHASDTFTTRLLSYWGRERQGTVPNPTHTSRKEHESCGDWIEIKAKVQDGVFVELQFIGAGCCVSECSSAITIEHMRGKTFEYVENFTHQDQFDLVNIKFPPKRIPCITLALECLKELVHEATNNS